MTLVAYYDLELHQMNFKTVFLNGDIEEMIYMVQIKKKSIYGLKQASPQWYQKFDQVITSLSFKENTIDQCIYHKISRSKFILLVLYVEDILLANSDIVLLHETKRFLSNNVEMKDLGNAYFVLDIQIH